MLPHLPKAAEGGSSQHSWRLPWLHIFHLYLPPTALAAGACGQENTLVCSRNLLPGAWTLLVELQLYIPCAAFASSQPSKNCSRFKMLKDPTAFSTLANTSFINLSWSASADPYQVTAGKRPFSECLEQLPCCWLCENWCSCPTWSERADWAKDCLLISRETCGLKQVSVEAPQEKLISELVINIFSKPMPRILLQHIL